MFYGRQAYCLPLQCDILTCKMSLITNELKTKEIVFHKPCPQRFHVGSSIDGIERVARIKLLGVIVQESKKVSVLRCM